jgi:hypothetical protein
MSTLALALALVAGPLNNTWATKRVEVTPFAGWMWGGSLDVTRGELEIEPSLDYGATIDVTLRPGAQAQLLYARQDTELLLKPRGSNVLEPLFDIAVQYFQIGGLLEVPAERFRPFLGLTLGATHMYVKENNVDDDVVFSGVLTGGFKILLPPHLAIRMQMRMYMSFVGVEGSLFCGTGAGCFGGISAGDIVFQGDATIGLTIAI